MSKKPFDISKLTESVEVDEVDLAPMLALMVTLIPILLLSSAFTQLHGTRATLPQMIKGLANENQTNEERAQLFVKVDGSVVSINWSKGSDKDTFIKSYNIAAAEGANQLSQALVSLKKRDPQLVLANLEPSEKTSYDQINKAIDLLKKPTGQNSQRIEFEIADPKTGLVAKTQQMFPVVEIANIYSGGL